MKRICDFSGNELLIYLKTRNLNSVAVFVLDMIVPFNRIFAVAAAVSAPLLKIFFRSGDIDAFISFLDDRPGINDLKNKLQDKN